MRLIMLTPLLLLAACGQSAGNAGPDGLDRTQASQLNDAAAMLDANSVSANALTPDQEQTP